eukprot:1291106-Amphidinium_carterae.1
MKIDASRNSKSVQDAKTSFNLEVGFSCNNAACTIHVLQGLARQHCRARIPCISPQPRNEVRIGI